MFVLRTTSRRLVLKEFYYWITKQKSKNAAILRGVFF